MNVALVVGLLFLAGALYNLFGPQPNPKEALAGIAIAAVLIGLFLFMRSARRRDAEFLAWLLEHADAVRGGGAQYGELLITRDARLTQYEVVLSFLIVSFKVPSRLYVVGGDASAPVPIAFTLISLLLGWWGIPWGPIYTVRAVWRNLRGGTQRTVADLLAALEAQVDAQPSDHSPPDGGNT